MILTVYFTVIDIKVYLKHYRRKSVGASVYSEESNRDGQTRNRGKQERYDRTECCGSDKEGEGEGEMKDALESARQRCHDMSAERSAT